MKQIYCAFCKVQRRVYSRNHIGWTNVGLCILASLLLMFVVWQDFEPKAIIFLAVFISLAEVFTLVRWRLSMKCPYCGFDPLLYKKDRTAQVEQIKSTLDSRRNSVDFVMSSKNPFANLPKRPVDRSYKKLDKELH